MVLLLLVYVREKGTHNLTVFQSRRLLKVGEKKTRAEAKMQQLHQAMV